MTEIVALIAALSISVERIVEILKNLVPFLAAAREDKGMERLRRTLLHLLAAMAGIAVAWAARGQVQPVLNAAFNTKADLNFTGYIIIGLLSSGSSGFWNQSLGILEEIKKNKKKGSVA